MAVSSATTACMPSSSLLKPKINKCSTLGFNNINPNYSNATKKTVRKFLIRMNSESDSSTSAAVSEERGGDDEESPVMEVSKGPPSLISALNVEKALRGIAITDVDHYGTLGLRIGCSYDQVRVAYQSKVNELSSQGLDEEELNKQLELLKESYTILSSEDERRLYDWSLARSAKPDRYVWPFEVDITQAPKGTPPPKEPEDVGPTRVVGYFILGWLVLGFTLSIALNL